MEYLMPITGDNDAKEIILEMLYSSSRIQHIVQLSKMKGYLEELGVDELEETIDDSKGESGFENFIYCSTCEHWRYKGKSKNKVDLYVTDVITDPESESEEEYNDRYFVFVIQNNRIRSFVTERPYEYDAYDLDEVDDNSKNIDEIIEAFVDEQQPQELVGISYSDIQLNRLPENKDIIDFLEKQGKLEKASTTKKTGAAKKPAAAKKTSTAKKPAAAKKTGAAKKPAAAKKTGTAKKTTAAKKTSAAKKPAAAKKTGAAKKPVATKKTSTAKKTTASK